MITAADRDARRRYRKTPRGKYVSQKVCAHQRGVDFNLTFEEWWGIWTRSRRWNQRGCKKGQYVMARYADEGAYESGNVHIIRHEGNVAERNQLVALQRHTPKATPVIFVERSVFDAAEAPF